MPLPLLCPCTNCQSRVMSAVATEARAQRHSHAPIPVHPPTLHDVAAAHRPAGTTATPLADIRSRYIVSFVTLAFITPIMLSVALCLVLVVV